jgi:hypothetical protein
LLIGVNGFSIFRHSRFRYSGLSWIGYFLSGILPYNHAHTVNINRYYNIQTVYYAKPMMVVAKTIYNVGKLRKPVFPGEWIIYTQSLQLQKWSSGVTKSRIPEPKGLNQPGFKTVQAWLRTDWDLFGVTGIVFVKVQIISSTPRNQDITPLIRTKGAKPLIFNSPVLYRHRKKWFVTNIWNKSWKMTWLSAWNS